MSAASSAGRKPFSATQLTYGSFRISTCATRDAFRCNQFQSRATQSENKIGALSVTRRHSEALGGTQRHSGALRGTREHSEALGSTQRHSEALSGNRRHSGGTQRHSGALGSPALLATRGYHGQSWVLRGALRATRGHSVVLRRTRWQSAHLHLPRRNQVNSVAISGNQWQSVAISSPASPATRPSQCTRTHRTPLPPRVAAALSPRSRGDRDADRRRGRPRAESAVQIRKRSK